MMPEENEDKKRRDAGSPDGSGPTAEKKGKNLHAGHRNRMWKRYARSGFDGYQPHEVLEQLLYLSYPRQDTNPIAHRILKRFGTLENVLYASCEELMQVDGVGEKSALLIVSMREIVTAEILRQYCGSRMMLADASFLWDWFLRRETGTAAGWIGCDAKGNMNGFRVVRDLSPDRESLRSFGETCGEIHGCLLVNYRTGWNDRAFAFLDGVLSTRGGRLHDAVILRRRKVLRLWNHEIQNEPLNSYQYLTGRIEP